MGPCSAETSPWNFSLSLLYESGRNLQVLRVLAYPPLHLHLPAPPPPSMSAAPSRTTNPESFRGALPRLVSKSEVPRFHGPAATNLFGQEFPFFLDQIYPCPSPPLPNFTLNSTRKDWHLFALRVSFWLCHSETFCSECHAIRLLLYLFVHLL